MSFCYPKSLRIRKRYQYQRIARQSTRQVGQWIIVESCRTKSSSTRLGISASRYFGKAVQRNRFKRIVREAFRLCRKELLTGLDLNVKPRSSALLAKPTDILKEFIDLFGGSQTKTPWIF